MDLRVIAVAAIALVGLWCLVARRAGRLGAGEVTAEARRTRSSSRAGGAV